MLMDLGAPHVGETFCQAWLPQPGVAKDSPFYNIQLNALANQWTLIKIGCIYELLTKWVESCWITWLGVGV